MRSISTRFPDMSMAATDGGHRSKSSPQFDTSRQRVDCSDGSASFAFNMSKNDKYFDMFCQSVDRRD